MDKEEKPSWQAENIMYMLKCHGHISVQDPLNPTGGCAKKKRKKKKKAFQNFTSALKVHYVMVYSVLLKKKVEHIRPKLCQQYCVFASRQHSVWSHAGRESQIIAIVRLSYRSFKQL